MQVWHGLECIRDPFPATTAAVGMFDGVHVGHQALIRAAVADAHTHGRAAAVFRFDRHPAELIAPDRVPGYLGVPRLRDAQMDALGVDHLVVARFDDAFRKLSPESFLRFVLIGVLGVQAVYVGEDFRFGRDQAGDVAYLREAERRWGFALHVLPPVRMPNGERASSSRVRQLLREGDLIAATAMLGHPYVLSGTVVRGEQLGRKLGFPTANLAIERSRVLPADGIYAVWASSEREPTERLRGACSIGMRPTVGGTERTVETYLLDFDGDLYGQRLDVEFVARLRDERKFQSLEDLTVQMARDVDKARELLA